MVKEPLAGLNMKGASKQYGRRRRRLMMHFFRFGGILFWPLRLLHHCLSRWRAIVTGRRSAQEQATEGDGGSCRRRCVFSTSRETDPHGSSSECVLRPHPHLPLIGGMRIRILIRAIRRRADKFHAGSLRSVLKPSETCAWALFSRRVVIFPEAEQITWACLVGGRVAVGRGRRRSH